MEFSWLCKLAFDNKSLSLISNLSWTSDNPGVLPLVVALSWIDKKFLF